MKTSPIVVLVLCLLAAPSVAQWTQWRGSTAGQGIIEGRAPGIHWSETVNILWKIVSMVLYEDHLYGLTNRGELACMDAKSGIELWRERFRTPVQSSPFVAGGHLYLTLRKGVTKVIRPDPEQYIEVAENVLPGIVDATLAVVDMRIYYRTDKALYCIGER